jgi:CRP-like cAMP-binding protein
MSLSPAIALAALANNPWFEALPQEVRERLVAEAQDLHLPAGGQLFRQGDPADHWFAIVRGALYISRIGVDGREHVFALVEPGDWFSETAILTHSPHLSTGVAREPTHVLAVPSPVFQELMRSSVDFARAVAELVARRGRRISESYSGSAIRPAVVRVAERLLLLLRGDAAHVPRNRSTVTIAQEVFARMLGISRQALSEELQKMSRNGLIRIGYRSIEILDETGLQEIAGGGDADPQ